MDELKQVLSRDEFLIPETELQKIIKEVDTNQDNVVDYNEFIEMMEKM